MNFITSMDPHTCILGDEMDLGKTIQTLEACQRVRENGTVR
jgi:SNF2 family DNA or RNA helicase